MRPTAGIYGEKYLSVYSFHPDMHIKLGNSLDSARIAHFSYEFGGRVGGGNVFLLKNDNLTNSKVVKRIERDGNEYIISHDSSAKKGRERIGLEESKQAFLQNNVKIDLLPGEAFSDLEEFILADVGAFVNKPAKETGHGYFQRVEKLDAKTRLKLIHPSRVLTPGKEEFVSACLFEANLDFGQGCITSFVPSSGANFDGSTFENYFWFPSGECGNCYASRKHRSFPKTVYEFDSERLKEEIEGGFILDLNFPEVKLGKKINVIRFGKRTESFIPLEPFISNFKSALEVMVETGTRAIIPTKFLEYDAEIAQLIKRTGSSVLFSVSDFAQQEKGRGEWGRDSQWAVEQALKYQKKIPGQVGLYHNTLGFYLTEKDLNFIEISKKNGLKHQFLPQRFYTNEQANHYIGLNLSGLRDKEPSLFEFGAQGRGKFSSFESKTNLDFASLDPRILDLILNHKEQFGLCHHDAKITSCGGCFQNEPAINKTQMHALKFRKGKKQTSMKGASSTPLFNEE